MFRRKIERTVKNMVRLILIGISLLLFYSFFLCNSCVSQLFSSVTVKLAQMFHVKHT